MKTTPVYGFFEVLFRFSTDFACFYKGKPCSGNELLKVSTKIFFPAMLSRQT